MGFLDKCGDRFYPGVAAEVLRRAASCWYNCRITGATYFGKAIKYGVSLGANWKTLDLDQQACPRLRGAVISDATSSLASSFKWTHTTASM